MACKCVNYSERRKMLAKAIKQALIMRKTRYHMLYAKKRNSADTPA
jgi:hypothetical protein